MKCKICKKTFKPSNKLQVYCDECCKRISNSNKIINNKFNK